MESVITQLVQQKAWEEFLAYRLLKGRFNWHEFVEADRFVEQETYLRLAQKIVKGESMGMPQKKVVNKMGTGKKRVVYSFAPEEMMLLKLIAFKLYDYDEHFAPNCYAFRRGVKAHDAIRNIRRAIGGRKMWAYKLDIHDYFNSISIDILLPMLEELWTDDPLLYHFFEKMLTDDRAVYKNDIIHESHGVMAGTPTAPFLADVYMEEVDRHFYESGVVYARYSDDIIMFAPDLDTLQEYKRKFLGFKCHSNDIDISESTKKKMKGKIKRAAKSLMRWSRRKHIEPEKAMKGLINRFNRKFYESNDTEALTWSRWFFPIINKTEGLKEIDHYLQHYIRYLGTGRHSKVNYKTDYLQLKQLGYRSLVNEFYKFKESVNNGNLPMPFRKETKT